jgi:predicted xylose isomerase-like sugar epimerase
VPERHLVDTASHARNADRERGSRRDLRARAIPGDLLQSGQVRIAEDSRVGVLTPAEIGLRFNNWDRVRAERLPLLLASAAGCAVAALMLLLVLTGRLAWRGEESRAAA